MGAYPCKGRDGIQNGGARLGDGGQVPVQLGTILERFAAAHAGVPHVLRLAGTRPGPRVGLVALVHGNEPAGALALARLLDLGFHPRRGELLLMLAHPEAARRGVRFLQQDLNRIWHRLERPDAGVELRRARELAPLLARLDVVLDIHTTRHPTPPFLIVGRTSKALELARRIATPPIVVRDEGHAAGRRLVDYGPFVDPAHPATALLLEAGSHGDPASVDAAVACVLALLLRLDMLPAEMEAWLPPVRGRDVSVLEVVRTVTVAREPFVFRRDVTHFARLGRAGSVLARDGDEPVLVPDDDCIAVLPLDHPRRGHTAVRLARLAAGPPLPEPRAALRRRDDRRDRG